MMVHRFEVAMLSRLVLDGLAVAVDQWPPPAHQGQLAADRRGGAEGDREMKGPAVVGRKVIFP
jgi:hypothetical protein